MNPLRKWLRLGPDERRELLRAGVAVPAIRLGLSTLPFDTLDMLLSLLETHPEPEGAPVTVVAAKGNGAEVERVRWAVAAVGRRLPGATCLTQALAARMLLGRKGIAAEVRIGVKRDGAGRITGHAWLKSDAAGDQIGEDEGYLPLPERGRH